MAVGSSAVRVDKWLWAVRVYKSRSISNEACSSNRVLVNDEVAKPATKVKIGDVVEARRKDRTVIYKVVQLLEKRVGASLVPAAVEDLSPPAPVQADADGLVSGRRDRGTGRPTKRDRREIERFRGRQ